MRGAPPPSSPTHSSFLPALSYASCFLLANLCSWNIKADRHSQFSVTRTSLPAACGPVRPQAKALLFRKRMCFVPFCFCYWKNRDGWKAGAHLWQLGSFMRGLTVLVLFMESAPSLPINFPLFRGHRSYP